MCEFLKTLSRIQTRNVEIHNKIQYAFSTLKSSRSKTAAKRKAVSILNESNSLIAAQQKDISFSKKYLKMDDFGEKALSKEILELRSLVALINKLSRTVYHVEEH